MLDLVIRGGQVVTPQGVGAWDVGVEGDRIVAVAAPGTLPRDTGRVVDASGRLVIPGGIDPHVHLHGSDYSAWDGWEVHGWPAVVILRGKIVVENGKLSGQAGDGRRVPGKIAAAIQDGPAV